MKNPVAIILVICCLSFAGVLSAQSRKTIPVGKSGCTVTGYCDFKLTVSKSEDSSTVYAGECLHDHIIYGLICVQLLQPPDSIDQAEALTTAYLDYLQKEFGIRSAEGYTKGLRLPKVPGARGIADRWQDGDKNSWRVNGWTNGKFITVLYVYAQSFPAAEENKIKTFLEGIRFPAK